MKQWGACREKEQVQRPHLVVVPLSTFPNWEREFALWAPQLNVVPFIGNQAGRNIVKQHELYADPSLIMGRARTHSKHAELQVANSCSCDDAQEANALTSSFSILQHCCI